MTLYGFYSNDFLATHNLKTGDTVWGAIYVNNAGGIRPQNKVVPQEFIVEQNVSTWGWCGVEIVPLSKQGSPLYDKKFAVGPGLKYSVFFIHKDRDVVVEAYNDAIQKTMDLIEIKLQKLTIASKKVAEGFFQ